MLYKYQVSIPDNTLKPTFDLVLLCTCLSVAQIINKFLKVRMRNNFELGLCLRCDINSSLCLGYYAIDVVLFISYLVYGIEKMALCKESLFGMLQSDDRGRNSRNNHPGGNTNKIEIHNQQTSGLRDEFDVLTIGQEKRDLVNGLAKMGICEASVFRLLQSNDCGRDSCNNHPGGIMNKSK